MSCFGIQKNYTLRVNGSICGLNWGANTSLSASSKKLKFVTLLSSGETKILPTWCSKNDAPTKLGDDKGQRVWRKPWQCNFRIFPSHWEVRTPNSWRYLEKNSIIFEPNLNPDARTACKNSAFPDINWRNAWKNRNNEWTDERKWK